jgi:hypothetical protein
MKEEKVFWGSLMIWDEIVACWMLKNELGIVGVVEEAFFCLYENFLIPPFLLQYPSIKGRYEY